MVKGAGAMEILGVEFEGRPMRGTKHDSGKPRWDLLPWREIGAVVSVLTYGSERYGPNNWQRLERPRGRYLAALMRHVSAWSCGERFDTESGLPHMAHAAANALFLLWADNAATGEAPEVHRD